MKKFLIVIILLIAFIFVFKTNSIYFPYKENWNINIPNPYKVETPIKYLGAGDSMSLDVLHYKSSDIEKLKDMIQLKEIDDNFNSIYKDVVSNNFIKKLSEEEANIFYNIVNFEDFIKNNQNCYVLLEKSTKYRKNIYNLLLIDVDKKIVYSINSNF